MNPTREPAGPTDDDSAQFKSGLPIGYRAGIITAITVVLGFSLLFFRAWVFELSGEWTRPSIFAAALLLVAIVLEIITLQRALRLEDETPREYRLTVRWLLISTALMLLSLVIAGLAYASVGS